MTKLEALIGWESFAREKARHPASLGLASKLGRARLAVLALYLDSNKAEVCRALDSRQTGLIIETHIDRLVGLITKGQMAKAYRSIVHGGTANEALIQQLPPDLMEVWLCEGKRYDRKLCPSCDSSVQWNDDERLWFCTKCEWFGEVSANK